jgi:hypothetical protein
MYWQGVGRLIEIDGMRIVVDLCQASNQKYKAIYDQFLRMIAGLLRVSQRMVVTIFTAMIC